MVGITSLLNYQRQNPREAPMVRALSQLGTDGDNAMGHLTKGEIVVPKPMQTPGIMALLAKEMRATGHSPEQFRVGSPSARRNPRTGAQMFALWDSSGGYTSNRGTGYMDRGDINWEAGTGSSYRGSDSARRMKEQSDRMVGARQGGTQKGDKGGSGSGLTLEEVQRLLPAGPPHRPANRVSADLGNAQAMQHYDPGMLSVFGLNYGQVPHYQANSRGTVDSAWQGQAAWSPTRAAGDVGSMLLGPIGTVLNMGASAAGLYPNDWVALNLGSGGGESYLGPSQGSENDKLNRRPGSGVGSTRNTPAPAGGNTNTPQPGTGPGGVVLPTPGAVSAPNYGLDYLLNYGFGPAQLMYPWHYQAKELAPLGIAGLPSNPDANVISLGQYWFPTIGKAVRDGSYLKVGKKK